MMITLLIIMLLTSILFYECLIFLNFQRDLTTLKDTLNDARKTLMSKTLSDLEKEQASRRLSVSVLKTTLKFVVTIAIAVAATMLFIYVCSLLVSEDFKTLAERLVTIPMLVFSLVAILVYHRLRSRISREKERS